MTQRDPLFDKDAPDQSDVTDELIETNADKPEPGEEARAGANELKSTGENVAQDVMQKGRDFVGKVRDRMDQMSGNSGDKSSR